MSTQKQKAEELEIQKLELEQRKVKALEKIGSCLDALTLWFEEIDKDAWDQRIQWYLALWKEKYIDADEE